MTDELPTGRVRRALSLAKVGAQAGASWAVNRGSDAAARSTAEVLGNLRGLAAKVGQTASYVDGLVPPEQREAYEKALSVLQRSTPASPWPEVRRTIEVELGQGLPDLFSWFEETPIASASIGQVHRATLQDGTPVAVKVQHAGIEAAVEADLKNIGMLEGVINLAGPRGLRAGPIFAEVMHRFRQELDYRNEVKNQQAFARLHASDAKIRIPSVFPTHCGRRVMTSSWAEGFSLERACEQPDDLRRSYAETLWRFVFRGNLVGGAFNADPHPGNYVFHSDGGVTFLDFGCVQPIPETTRRAAVRAHASVMSGDWQQYKKAIADMLGTRGGAFGEATNRYTKLCFEPLLHDRFRLTSAYAAQLVLAARDLKRAMKAGDGSFVQPPPQLALMNRLQFGFYSVMGRLDVELDYRAIEGAFLEEARSIERGLLELD